MYRKFATGFIAASTLVSGIAQALGLGEATVQSALNQPLKAEIELVNIRDLQPNEIIANLAPREEFLRVGVDRVFFLSDLRFKVVYKDNGKAVIQVTSSKPVREPYLDFLVEVTWPNGRLLREYALLIDPPTYSLEIPQPVTPAATSAPARVAPAVTSQATVRSEPARQVTPAGAQGTSYGPTRPTDTLWDIAMRFRPDNRITPQQMMLAIQDLNPGAFIDGNINKLKAGQVLRIPTAEQALSRTAREAIAAVSAQNRALKQKALTRSAIDATGRQSSGQPVEQATGEDELRIVVADSSGESGSESGLAEKGRKGGSARVSGSEELGNQLALVMERLDATSRENAELKARLKELEAQMETLSRLATVKNDQLAALQRQQALEAEQDSGRVPAGSDVSPAESTETAVTGETAAPQPEVAVTPVTEDSATAVVTEQAGESAGADTVQPAAETEKSQPDGPVEERPVQKPVAEEPVKPEDLPEPGLFEKLMSDPLYQAGAGGALLAILLVLWGISRKRHQDELGGEEDQVTITQVDQEGGAPEPEDESTELVSAEAAGESQDAIAEADAYIAYQRFDDAARVLEDALNQFPADRSIQLKLLEVLGESRQSDRFNDLYAELLNSGDEDLIAQVEALHERYADLNADSEVSLEDLESQLLSGGDFDTQMSTHSHTAADTEGEQANRQQDNSDEDVLAGLEDLDQESLEAGAQESDQASLLEEEDDNLDIEFDLSDLDLGEEAASDEADAVASQKDDSSYDEGIDFNLDLTAETEKEADTASDEAELVEPEPLTEDGETLDVDLGLDAESDKSEIDGEALEIGLDLEAEDGTQTEDVELDDELSAEFLEAIGEADETTPPADQVTEPDLSLDEELADLEADTALVDEVSVDLSGADQEGGTGEAIELDMDDLESLELDDDTAALDLEDVEGQLEALDESLEEADALLDELNLDESEDSELETEVEDTEPASEEASGAAEEDEAEAVTTSETPAQSTTEAAGGDLDEVLDEDDFDFLADTDEAATKLDLARAYIDMGDKDGARDILEEVAEEGNPAQQEEARTLLDNL